MLRQLFNDRVANLSWRPGIRRLDTRKFLELLIELRRNRIDPDQLCPVPDKHPAQGRYRIRTVRYFSWDRASAPPDPLPIYFEHLDIAREH